MIKFKLLLFSILGEFIKILYNLRLAPISYGINTTEYRKEKIIVSLTSYGRRVSSILYYTILSILRQTYKPDVIVLWLDYDNWNINNLPLKIKKLEKYGLTIRFCKDIKSYKKLIPALEAYPNDIIITLDDDLFYSKNVIEKLVHEYKKSSDHVYTHRAHQVCLTKDGAIIPYNDWKSEVYGVRGPLVFPTGGAGCLYRKSMLYKDICNEKLFMKLSPKADDVWFYFMEFLQGTENVVLPNTGYTFIPLDNFYQYFHKEASLYTANCKESQNDLQIKNVMEYYNLTASDFSKFL